MPLRFQLDKLHYVCNTQLVQLGRRMMQHSDGAAFTKEFTSFRTAYTEQYQRLQQSPTTSTDNSV